MPETIPKDSWLTSAGVEPSETDESALADRLFELVARFRRPRPIGPPRDDDREMVEQQRQRHGQMRMLFALGHAAPLTVQDLARVLEVSAPTASVLAKKAFEEGLVERRRDSADSRVVWLDLAGAGRERLRDHRRDRMRRFDQLIDAHPELDRAEIARSVEVLLQLFDRDPRGSGPHHQCRPDSQSDVKAGEA